MKRIDQILEMWSKDGPLDLTALDIESSNKYKLHAKYQKMYAEEGRRLREMTAKVDQFRLDALIFYRDGMSKENKELVLQRGWRLPPQGKPLKSDIEQYVRTNPDIVTLNLELADQSDCVDLIEDILKTIAQRGYSVGNAIKWIALHVHGVD
jgi:hypothetical protein